MNSLIKTQASVSHLSIDISFWEGKPVTLSWRKAGEEEMKNEKKNEPVKIALRPRSLQQQSLTFINSRKTALLFFSSGFLQSDLLQ